MYEWITYYFTSLDISEFTWRPLTHGLHDDLEFLEGQYTIFVSVEEHEYLLPVSHLDIYPNIRSYWTAEIAVTKSRQAINKIINRQNKTIKVSQQVPKGQPSGIDATDLKESGTLWYVYFLSIYVLSCLFNVCYQQWRKICLLYYSLLLVWNTVYKLDHSREDCPIVHIANFRVGIFSSESPKDL